MTQIDVAWVAGFFEGEAHFRTESSQITVRQVQRQPLETLERLVGGKIYGPYKNPLPNRSDFYDWRCYGPACRAISEAVFPFMSPKRQRSIETMFLNWLGGRGQDWRKGISAKAES